MTLMMRVCTDLKAARAGHRRLDGPCYWMNQFVWELARYDLNICSWTLRVLYSIAYLMMQFFCAGLYIHDHLEWSVSHKYFMIIIRCITLGIFKNYTYASVAQTASDHAHNEFKTDCIPTELASSLLITYGLRFSFPTPASAPPPAPLNLSRKASGPIWNSWLISVSMSKLDRNEASKDHLLSISWYLVRSFPTMKAPVALTWNFLKWSRSWVRRPMANSVRKMVRFAPSRACVAWSLTRVRKL